MTPAYAAVPLSPKEVSFALIVQPAVKEMKKMKDRNVIWSNESLNLEDWRADLEEEYPGYSDDELYEIMCETNADYRAL